MREDNWTQVTEIFEAALELPPAARERFLQEICADAAVRREVRELLNSFDEDDGFLEGAAIAEVADLFVRKRSSLNPGDALGRYRVQATLGRGGMGEVFLATDEELERFVALKILSPEFVNDERLRRFVREAKSASALNHPNILTIYEIGAENGWHYIAAEFVKGETLRARAERQPLSLGETLEIIEQVGAALAAAHQRGIIHRDIKPENIMVRDDGLVKVLDFGLAKLIRRAGENSAGEALRKAASSVTVPGMIMGTVAYMSPEQARGKATGGQTDIWSLGAVLYEIINGAQPFAGETASDVIAQILTAEPVYSEKCGHKINLIIKKALHKNPAERYQRIEDFLSELKTLRSEDLRETFSNFGFVRVTDNFRRAEITNDSTVVKDNLTNEKEKITGHYGETPIKSVKLRWQRKTGWLLAAIALVLCAIAGINLSQQPKFSRTIEPLQSMRWAKLTASGNVADAISASSPDGNYVAFVMRDGEQRSLWVKQVATSANIRIVPPARVKFGEVAFSADGNYIYYSVLAEKESAPKLFRIPALGGAPQKVIENLDNAFSFSPDGSRIAFVRGGDSIVTAAADGSDELLLAKADEGRSWELLAWAPGGESLVASAYSSIDNLTYLLEIDYRSGAVKSIGSAPWIRLNGLAWLPDKSALVIAGRDTQTKLSQLWLMPHPMGEIRRITNDLNSYQSVSLSADGKKIFSFQQELLASIWLSESGNLNLPRQLTYEKGKNEGMSGVSLGGDGKIVYTVRHNGAYDLWMINSDGSGQRQLTFNAGSNFSPVRTPDNRYIVFVSTRSGNGSLWRMDADGENPRQLTDNQGVAGEPYSSPDGKWIVYQHTDLNNKTFVWKVGIEGGEPVKLTESVSERPVIAPSGDYFICNYQIGTDPQAPFHAAIISMTGGQPLKILNQPAIVKSRNVRWSADGKNLIYIDARDGNENLWSQAIDGGAPKQLTDLKSEKIFRFDFSASAEKFAMARGQENSDIIMIENFR